jgi:amino acid permease
MANSLFRKKSIAQIQADAAAGLPTPRSFPGQTGEEPDAVRCGARLGTFDLTMLGYRGDHRRGHFAMVGQASYNGGPGVVILFIFAAIACGFAALCYAEFASKIPIAGSAYTYAYASFG